MLVLSPQLHFKCFKVGNLIEGISVPPWPGSPLSGLPRSHWQDPTGALSFLPQSPPVCNALPWPSPKILLSGMRNHREGGLQQLGLIPFTPKARYAPPPNSAPNSCGPGLLASLLPHFLTLALRKEKYHQDRVWGGAVTSSQLGPGSGLGGGGCPE